MKFAKKIDIKDPGRKERRKRKKEGKKEKEERRKKWLLCEVID